MEESKPQLPPGATHVTKEEIAAAQGQMVDSKIDEQMQAIKDQGQHLINLIAGLGDSRELTIARTKAEESVMWAVKHITA